ncbi:hypothetical protein B7486_56290 [cyanobacterium TDX16]|nr:hypothetical protein B7486_56290 [cyanobacterium TDX16]
MIELLTEGDPVVFDGVVLEVFSPGGCRLHVTQIRSMSLAEGRKGVTVLHIDGGRHGGVSGEVVPAEGIATFHEMVAAVDEVRRQRYGLEPVGSS